MSENLHIFLDGVGRYADESWRTYQSLQKDKNIVINLATPSKVTNEEIRVVNDVNEIKKIIISHKIKRVYFHFFNFYVSTYFIKLKKQFPHIIYAWVFWSGDFYGHVLNPDDEYTPFSLDYYYKNPTKEKFSIKIKKWLKQIIFPHATFNLKELYRRYNMLDYICTTFDGDFKNIVQKSGITHPKRLPYSYFQIEQLLTEFPYKWLTEPKEDENKKWLMIGHSAALNNNHLDILQIISQWAKIPPILLPLSYGLPTYKQALIETCSKKLNEKTTVKILEQFLDKKEYFTMLDSVSIAIFNNKVQKGFGNIIPLLWSGAKLFFREENVVYQEFKNEGMVVFNLQKEFNEKNFIPLTKDEIKINRKIIKKLFSKDKVAAEILSVLSI